MENFCEENNLGYIYNEFVLVCYKIDLNLRLFMDVELFCEEFGGYFLWIDIERK